MRKLLVLLALAATAALAGACSSPEDGEGGARKAPERAERPTAVETVQVAYKETAAEQTAKTSFEITTTGPPMDPNESGQSAPMEMTITGQGIMDFSGAASSLTMEMFGMGNFEMRQIGNTVYMKMPEGGPAQMPGARPWIRVDLDDAYEREYGANPAQMPGGAAGDPTRQLEYLRGVSDSVEKVGTEKVRGVQTTRYEAILDLRKEAAGRGAEVREAQEEIIEQIGTSKLPVEVWLDDQNRVRRYAMDVAVPVPENASAPGMPEGGKMRTSMVAEYYDFGTPVEVQAPPQEQTTDGSKMFSRQPVAR
ncbi:hypothetical protein GBA63_00770 [Rubrobacter tropicus]|uniref:Lipoprotein n=1 Tax=Rubrobacter tropicus TaxID=2653851 RepID=A0A6G8Q4C4_9ACTN|nr:hypothetical protein [Rubrobacter tropicus]QIN81316.1 hypothetical protein GBA63_00770 [Rubrobacter tropicus]